MEISAESGVGKLNNFACYVFWLMLEYVVLSSPFHRASYQYLLPCRISITQPLVVKMNTQYA